MAAKSLPLVEAAFQAKVPYQKLYNALLAGEVNGYREDGKWFVDVESLTLWVTENERTA